jgi:hypothetical protein
MLALARARVTGYCIFVYSVTGIDIYKAFQSIDRHSIGYIVRYIFRSRVTKRSQCLGSPALGQASPRPAPSDRENSGFERELGEQFQWVSIGQIGKKRLRTGAQRRRLAAVGRPRRARLARGWCRSTPVERLTRRGVHRQPKGSGVRILAYSAALLGFVWILWPGERLGQERPPYDRPDRERRDPRTAIPFGPPWCPAGRPWLGRAAAHRLCGGMAKRVSRSGLKNGPVLLGFQLCGQRIPDMVKT